MSINQITSDPKKISDWAEIVINLSDIGIILVDENRQIKQWNQWITNSSGIPASVAIGNTLDKIFPELKSVRLFNAIDDVIQYGMPSILSQKLNPHILPLYKTTSDKSVQNLMAQMVMLKPIKAVQKYCLIQVVDVSSAVARDHLLRIQAENYRQKELHHRTILSSIADAVITTKANGCIDYMNSVAETMTGWSFDAAKDEKLEDVFSITSTHSISSIEECINNNHIPSTFGECLTLRKANGDTIAIEESLAAITNDKAEILGVVLVFRDVSKARKLADKVHWQAGHDSLTKLYNRNYFDRKLQALVEFSRSSNEHGALLYLDLDQFKIVNDTCGHVAGDELLKQLSQLLNSHVRNNDVLARLGGDEFGIILSNCPINIALEIAENIRKTIKDYRFSWSDKSFGIGVSIGIVEISNRSDSVEKLLSAADAACYAAKDGGRNQVHLYKPKSSEAAARHGEMQWFSRIQNALELNNFCLYAQNISALDENNNDQHIEILIRMIDEDGNIIPPGSFIPAAERFGLMSSIDRWVIEHVFFMIRQAINEKEWIPCHFAINLSGQTLSDAESLNFIVNQLSKHNIPQGMIGFEITETAAISNLSSANTFITKLKSVGCKFSLDDFGSGLSSFAYLKNLPVDYLKIDGAFVKDMVDDPIDYAMVQSINQIGHVMNLQTIAEFVENDDILDALKDIGVDFAQGYGINKPYKLIDENNHLTFSNLKHT